MKHMILFVAPLMLAACTYDARQPLSPDFGNAVRQNIAAQVANPAASADPADDPAWYGDVAVGSMERYRTGTTYQPKLLTGDGKSFQSGPQGNNGGAAR